MKSIHAVIFSALILFFVSGCSSKPKYIEGTSFSLGAYFPYNGSLMGLEVVNYLSGCAIKWESKTNQNITIERNYSATNDYFFGMVRTKEDTKTTIRIEE